MEVFSSLYSTLGFATPAALLGLFSLPIIWWLLRFIPPKPQSIAFPPVRILLEVIQKKETPDKTPWWLLLLRLLLISAIIIGVSYPLLSDALRVGRGAGPLLVVLDDGWASAHHWAERQSTLISVLQDAQRNSIPVVLTTTAPSEGKVEVSGVPADVALERGLSLLPKALNTDRKAVLDRLKPLAATPPSEIVWLSDGVDSKDAGGFVVGLASLFPGASSIVYLPSAAKLPLALSEVKLSGGDIQFTVMGASRESAIVQARAANGRILAEKELKLANGVATGAVSLPVELRNEMQSLVIAAEDHAGARFLLDDRWRRKTVAVQSGTSFENAQPLLSPLHYVSRGLEPFAEVRESTTSQDLIEQIDGGLSMMVLADVGRLQDEVYDKVAKWVSNGGVLVRFAGPRLAAAHDDLVPVALRQGGRELGSALSWSEPQKLQAFAANSVFAGLTNDTSVVVTQQVLADPEPDLADKTWASLEDGTPLVTHRKQGKGLLVLFHVTANADWSNLPLTGLFVDMLRRINDLAPAAGTLNATAEGQNLMSTSYAPRLMLSGRGDLTTPAADIKPISAELFDKALASAGTPPGLYARNTQERAINLVVAADDIQPIKVAATGWSAAIYEPASTTPLAPYLFVGAFLMLIADTVITYLIARNFKGFGAAAAGALFFLAILVMPHDLAKAEPSAKDIEAALRARLAFVKTGDSEVDQISKDGLAGLTLIVSDRTSAELAEPAGVDIETDEIVFYPVVYWPITSNVDAPSAKAVSKIEHYIKNGGTLFFDLRDDGLSTESLTGSDSETMLALQRILSKIDVPPLETVADNHVLTRSFYLLDEFPGRYKGGPLWVEAEGGDNKDPGVADGVSSIIIGSNDYASAWALGPNFEPLHAVIPGDERQREYAFRTGINIVMYALTGNYKADQVHVPALLERLGQ